MAHEKQMDESVVSQNERIDDVNVVKKVHADGAVDLIDARAIGGDLQEMPPGYYYSPQFIGTVTVRSTGTYSFHLFKLTIITGCLSCQYLCLSGLGSPGEHPVGTAECILYCTRALLEELIEVQSTHQRRHRAINQSQLGSYSLDVGQRHRLPAGRSTF